MATNISGENESTRATSTNPLAVRIFDGSGNEMKGYSLTDQYRTSGTRYSGFLNAKGEWYILKETMTSSTSSYRFCKGSTDYTTNWTNRASLSYDYFDAVFG